MLKFYGYAKCSTCINAKKWLKSNKVEFEDIEITETPPSKKLLKSLLDSEEIELKNLFNISGEYYRQMNLKEKLPNMSVSEQLDLLSSNGKLVKRPFITDGSKVTVGFKEDVLTEKWVRRT